MATELEKTVARAVAESGGLHQCALIGHDWQSDGGCNAGCSRDCGCSVPVHVCRACGDHDYGENEEADEIRKECLERRSND